MIDKEVHSEEMNHLDKYRAILTGNELPWWLDGAGRQFEGPWSPGSRSLFYP